MLDIAILAFGLAAAEPVCLHGNGETVEQAARRRDALHVVRYVNTVEAMGLEKAKRYVPLRQVPGIPVLAGFRLSLVTDGKDYMLAAKDAQDACGFAYMSDASGLIYEAQALKPR
jgi:hypothetical protein